MKSDIQKVALELGFCAIGITTAEPIDEVLHLNKAVKNGHIASMHWLARNIENRCDPRSLLTGARSVICCALAYGENGIEGGFEQPLPLGDKSATAKFARGADYHESMRIRLERLLSKIRERVPKVRAKICVDTSPILEKALAERSGLGWIGKHTLLLNENNGSQFVLGEIITDIEFDPDIAPENHCGACRLCIDACPTGALIAPRILDARRCISYLTIEHKGSLPNSLKCPTTSDSYGCDICQDACPHNFHLR